VLERVEDLSSRIPIEQKIQMMGNNAAAYEPLYIPEYQWWSEGLHGAMQSCLYDSEADQWKCPTTFPCPSGLGTTFNNSLFHMIGSVIGQEGRAFSNLRNHHHRRHKSQLQDGLDY
jgi:beta-glucosidase-like glycosyl hydrolase